MKIVYIVGAGFSKSIDGCVPVMNDFFEKAIELIDENVAWLVFAAAERARAFPDEPEIENLGTKMGVIGEYLSNNNDCCKNQDCQLKGKLEEGLRNTRQQYKKVFLSDTKRKKANLEDVFGKMEAHKDVERDNDANDTYVRLQFLINRLFNNLDKRLENEFLRAAHFDLSEYVKTADNLEHIFISFNYDLWLEKAFFKNGIWHPRDGHGTYLFEHYAKPEKDISQNMKPNGVVEVSNKFVETKEFSEKCQKARVKVLLILISFL